MLIREEEERLVASIEHPRDIHGTTGRPAPIILPKHLPGCGIEAACVQLLIAEGLGARAVSSFVPDLLVKLMMPFDVRPYSAE